MKHEILIIGAGITGITIARALAEKGEKIILYEKGDIGGNCHDLFEGKQYIQKYGAHIFHTNDEQVWNFLSRFTEWHDYRHNVFARVDTKLIHLPFNFSSIDASFDNAEIIKQKLLKTGKKSISILELRQMDDPDIKMLADYVYDKIFLNYTIKQWGHKPDEMDPKVVNRVPVKIGYEQGYFASDKYQGIPKNGYSAMFNKMLEHENITVRTGKILKKDIAEDYKKIILTGAVDEFYSFDNGPIQYRRIFLDFEKLPVSSFQENSVINYPNDESYTRITEYNKFLGIVMDSTVISKEYASWDKGFQAYPVFTDENQKIIEKYLLSAKHDNIILAGRMAECQYYNMDQACARGLEAARNT